MKKHAKFSPSGAAGWMACPGYEGSEGASLAAAEGTLVHDLALQALTQRVWLPSDHLGKTYQIDGYWIEVKAEMLAAVCDYVEYVNRLPGAHFVENELDLEGITDEPAAVGTADFVAVSYDELHVVDLKYGFGRVEAVGNKQMQIYALAALHQFNAGECDIQNITLHIFQPRIGNVVAWTVTREELEEFQFDVTEAIERHGKAGAELVPGESQCRWCKHNGRCDAQHRMVVAQLTEDVAELDESVGGRIERAIELVKHVDDVTLGRMMGAMPFIELWMKAVAERAQERLTEGHDVPGFKLVEGRAGNRKWVDERAAKAAFDVLGVGDITQEIKLVSPTVAEKRLDPRIWAQVSDMVTRAPGAPTVVPAGDKRPSITNNATL